MSTQPPPTSAIFPPPGPFNAGQKEYLAGFMAGAMQAGFVPFVGHTAAGTITSDPAPGLPNAAASTEPAEPNVYGTPVSELSKPELWKLEQNGLDIWDRLLAHAESDQLPDEQNTFYFRYHGMFYVGPAQESLMLRMRIPAGELTAVQMDGLADVAEDWGGGYRIAPPAPTCKSARSPRAISSRCSCACRNSASPPKARAWTTCATSPPRPRRASTGTNSSTPAPLAKAMHHYILNNRDLYGLPRKFNVAFDGGGAIDTAADTNDVGFIAVKVGERRQAAERGTGRLLPAGTCGITGHQQFAKDVGVLVRPEQTVAFGAAILRAFNETGDRTNRKKARLKYFVDRLG